MSAEKVGVVALPCISFFVAMREVREAKVGPDQ